MSPSKKEQPVKRFFFLFSVHKMPDLAQGGFRFSIYQRPSPGQSDVNANLPGHHPQGCKTFQPRFINPSFNPGFSSLSFSNPEFMVEESGVEN